jgi:uncharacterized membrane protein
MTNRELPRFWELDSARGLAVIMMVLYHLLYDLSYLGDYPLDMRSGFLPGFAWATAAIFITLVGISLTLSDSKARILGESDRLPYMLIRRGLKIFSLGLAITLATYILIGHGFILFGVLHFIGISIILAYPFLRLGAYGFYAGVAVILIGIYLQGITFDHAWLIWIGLIPDGFYTLDLFPIFPWFGLVLIGMAIGDRFYHDHERCFKLPDFSGTAAIRLTGALGRNSLVIYLVHQPVMVAVLILLGLVSLSIPIQWPG